LKRAPAHRANSSNEVFTNITLFRNFLEVSRKFGYSGCSKADEVLLATPNEVTEQVEAILSLMKTNATETVKLLLKAERRLLLRILLVPAPVRRSKECIGTIVDWNIAQGIEAARDKDTGLKFDLDQELFVDEVNIILPSIKNTSKKVIKVKGTVRNVLRHIHHTYQAERKEYRLLDFQGLWEEVHKGEVYYSLDIEVCVDFTAEPFVVN
jgi:hypothetical protein